MADCDTLRALHSGNVSTTSTSEEDIICRAGSEVQGPWPEEGSWHDLREHLFPEPLHVVAMIAALSLAVLVHLCIMLHLLQLQSSFIRGGRSMAAADALCVNR